MNVKSIVPYFTIISLLASGIYFIEARYALGANLKKLEQRFDVKQLKDAKYDLIKSRRYWKKELKENPNDQDAQSELEVIQEQLKDTNKQIDSILKK